MIQDSDRIKGFVEKINEANLVCAKAYGGVSAEYARADKETIAMLIEVNELREVNKLILEELKAIRQELNAKSEETPKKTPVRKTGNTAK